MGDGSTVTCDGPGVPYVPTEAPDDQTTTCEHTYLESSVNQPSPDGYPNDGSFTVVATVNWSVAGLRSVRQWRSASKPHHVVNFAGACGASGERQQHQRRRWSRGIDVRCKAEGCDDEPVDRPIGNRFGHTNGTETVGFRLPANPRRRRPVLAAVSAGRGFASVGLFAHLYSSANHRDSRTRRHPDNPGRTAADGCRSGTGACGDSIGCHHHPSQRRLTSPRQGRIGDGHERLASHPWRRVIGASDRCRLRRRRTGSETGPAPGSRLGAGRPGDGHPNRCARIASRVIRRSVLVSSRRRVVARYRESGRRWVSRGG